MPVGAAVVAARAPVMRSRITLVTRGRRSGLRREATLYAFKDGETDHLIVVGSKGGAAKDPLWVHNLRAARSAVVRDSPGERRVTAREADGEEHARLWSMITATSPMYEGFQRRTRRRIPLFVLEPER